MGVEIFEIENSIVKPTKEILLISPFKEIWERDKSKNKELAIKELSYIYFLMSPKKSNPYSGYSEELRGSKIIEGLWKEETYNVNELVETGVKKYQEFLEQASPSMRYFHAVKQGVEQTIKFFQNIDFSEKTDKGVPVYKISEVIPALKSANEVLKSMTDLQERVEQEVYESSKTKSGKEINHFER